MYHSFLRNDVDFVIFVFKSQWHEQFGKVILRVVAIIIRRQFTYEKLLISEMIKLQKKERDELVCHTRLGQVNVSTAFTHRVNSSVFINTVVDKCSIGKIENVQLLQQ